MLAQSGSEDTSATALGTVTRPMIVRVSPQASLAAANKIREIKTSMDRFQRLLAMNPVDREKALSHKSESQRSYLRLQLQKYSEMPREQRETALQALHVWYYVRELVKHPPEVRTNVLSLIPETERKPVEVRLQRWSLLPEDLQKEMLDYERTIRYVVQLEGLSRSEQKQIEATLPPNLRKTWDDKLEEWHALSPDRRQRIYAKSQKFFELSPSERARVLETLSQQERKQAEKSVQVAEELDKLSKEDRAACLESFKNFAETPARSTQLNPYLETIHQWREMSRKEKELLRRARNVLPPGLEPPMPGGTSKPPQGENKSAPPPVPGSPR